MSNLIITIISIGLVAIAAIMGIYYGGQAYSNAQINATANAIMNESQQILYAERLWSTNNGQPDISGMGTAGANGTGISALVNNKELTTWPSVGGNILTSINLTNPGPQPNTGSVSTGVYDAGCYNISGYFGYFVRQVFAYNNGNYVMYSFNSNTTATTPCVLAANNGVTSNGFATTNTDISQINHPVIKIAKAINAAMGQIPSNANTATMAYTGIPIPPAGNTQASNVWAGYSTIGNQLRVDANGTLQTNYCYYSYNTGVPYSWISCVFGPS